MRTSIMKELTETQSHNTYRRSSGFGSAELTENEIAWVEFLRLISNGRDLGPTLPRVQLLRRVCTRS